MAIFNSFLYVYQAGYSKDVPVAEGSPHVKLHRSDQHDGMILQVLQVDTLW